MGRASRKKKERLQHEIRFDRDVERLKERLQQPEATARLVERLLELLLDLDPDLLAAAPLLDAFFDVGEAPDRETLVRRVLERGASIEDAQLAACTLHEVYDAETDEDDRLALLLGAQSLAGWCAEASAASGRSPHEHQVWRLLLVAAVHHARSTGALLEGLLDPGASVDLELEEGLAEGAFDDALFPFESLRHLARLSHAVAHEPLLVRGITAELREKTRAAFEEAFAQDVDADAIESIARRLEDVPPDVDDELEAEVRAEATVLAAAVRAPREGNALLRALYLRSFVFAEELAEDDAEADLIATLKLDPDDAAALAELRGSRTAPALR